MVASGNTSRTACSPKNCTLSVYSVTFDPSAVAYLCAEELGGGVLSGIQSRHLDKTGHTSLSACLGNSTRAVDVNIFKGEVPDSCIRACLFFCTDKGLLSLVITTHQVVDHVGMSNAFEDLLAVSQVKFLQGIVSVILSRWRCVAFSYQRNDLTQVTGDLQVSCLIRITVGDNNLRALSRCEMKRD